VSAVPAHLRKGARAVAVAPIIFYQRAISPALPRRCKYEPTCSRYAVQAIKRYGILKGLILAAWRLLRCNPFSHGGFDPVESQKLFRTRVSEAMTAAATDARYRPARPHDPSAT
jgi:putative membrane protein insertion efficiency factor